MQGSATITAGTSVRLNTHDIKPSVLKRLRTEMPRENLGKPFKVVAVLDGHSVQIQGSHDKAVVLRAHVVPVAN